MKAVGKLLLTLALIFQLSPTQAAERITAEIPTGWRLQNYAGGTIILWFTDTDTWCPGGKLEFRPGVPVDDKNRLWSTAMTAIVSNKKMYIYFDDAGPCYINSFGLDGNL
jgi:hypothetical protein